MANIAILWFLMFFAHEDVQHAGTLQTQETWKQLLQEACALAFMPCWLRCGSRPSDSGAALYAKHMPSCKGPALLRTNCFGALTICITFKHCSLVIAMCEERCAQ
jgi:hypothetical protein